eukprot:gnl/MRDRNA2_/MRDRNA2_115316_c0_seq1.p1 gnl/MRDRNA2_/MRDRNA2_115316_c0~~gnl/MRDRNA2_/MRDRNA2_115316_c0_seq1.p1  ORF type:complete len:374 (+),score=65.66 gnl/MRDRNA2_/MRDRNA2_115316_c0_seq1:88-1209(+)
MLCQVLLVFVLCFFGDAFGSHLSSAICTGNTTAQDVAKTANLSGKVAIVTGGDGGLGYPVVVALARQGAAVVIATHNQSKGEAAAERAAKESGGKVVAMLLDLSSFVAVKSFVKQFSSVFGANLHILVNNAGIDGNPPHFSTDGFQLLFQINYLSPFLLTELLLPALKNSGTQDFPGKVINVASSEESIACAAANFPEGCLHDWRYLPAPALPQINVTLRYPDGGTEVRPVELYGFTKSLAIQHAKNLAERMLLEGNGTTHVEAFSLSPGWVNTSLTNMIPMNSTTAKRKCEAQGHNNPCPFSPEEGAAISVFCALNATESGAYYSRIRECQTDTATSHGFSDAMGPELYRRTLQWVGLPPPGTIAQGFQLWI